MHDDHWKALSGRIRGLVQAGQLHARFLTVRSTDPYGRAKSLREQIIQVFSALKKFGLQFEHTLPPVALQCIENFVSENKASITNERGGQDIQQELVWLALVRIAAFETQLSFILCDIQESIRARSELAFSHLQRLIAVDQDFRGKWKTAFEEGEVACEKLGAVHLMWHGIWAFKVDGIGARTDLIFEEPVETTVDVQRYVHGLVLTEWKVAKANNAEEKFREAFTQARLYTQRILAGIELRGYRYAVVVSTHKVNIPSDYCENGVIHRHVNIAVDPLVPSAEAAKNPT